MKKQITILTKDIFKDLWHWEQERPINLKEYRLFLKNLCKDVKVKTPYLYLYKKPAPVLLYSRGKRKGQIKLKYYGIYYPFLEHIKMYMYNPSTLNPTKPKVQLETLLHEFMHHYDYNGLRLMESFHNKKFYKRIKTLKQILLEQKIV